ncbi:MAG: translation initiation factor IF-6 [Candidatus Micrarchaeota archaeon]
MKISYYGNPWIGMFIKTNNEVTMLPVDSMKKVDDAVDTILKTKTVKISMGDSNLLGIYIVMNSNGIILPNIVKQEEVDILKKIGLNVHISSGKFNAHGNNIAVNDKGGIINPNIEKEDAKKIADTLGVELVPMKIADFSTVGSACIATNTGYLAHFKANDDEIEQLNEVLKVRGSKGTMNTGTGFVSYGAVVNKNGYIIGDSTTAYEIGRLEDALNIVK